MSHSSHLSILKQSPDFRFRDLAELNAELYVQTDVDRLLDGMDFIVAVEGGGFAFWDRECVEHQARADVHGCVDAKALKIIAAHIQSGRLLLCLSHEGCNTMEFHLLSPDTVTEYDFPLPL